VIKVNIFGGVLDIFLFSEHNCLYSGVERWIMDKRPHIIPAIVAVIMLIVAVAPLPYGYYQFLRWIICGISIFVAYESYEWGKSWATWVFIPVAILFNPLFPIYLDKSTWRPIDIFCAFLFASSLFLSRPGESKPIVKPK